MCLSFTNIQLDDTQGHYEFAKQQLNRKDEDTNGYCNGLITICKALLLWAGNYFQNIIQKL